MAEIIFLKSPQPDGDIFGELERDLKGQLVLSGLPVEIASNTMARMRRIYDRCVERKIDFSFSFDPIVRLTAEEAANLKRQIENVLTDEIYGRSLGYFFMAAIIEVGRAEGEICQARRGEI